MMRTTEPQRRLLARLQANPFVVGGAGYQVPLRERRTAQGLARRGLLILDADPRTLQLLARLPEVSPGA